ncbi:hypothetical protein HPSA50_0229 [Helicobacter pylori SouthAfrica50]|uniref:Protoporphyrinogen IX oxidase n=1 Tax=Helicobacter pylori SouthAfrica50 TaxID=1352357 RepID=T2SAT9_HELPX|nr:hypothetical protein HPSA50_0229 [Helicobacter pylori SouthAfrica50]
MEFLSGYFMWIKAFHVIAVISWMAALFYLPRLFVYHAENAHKKEFVEVVRIQEKSFIPLSLHRQWVLRSLQGF